MARAAATSDDPAPEPDRREGAPHPRDSSSLFGHDEAEAEILAAIASGKLHSGWLLTGPEGIGKATLAYRMAATLLAGDPAPTRLGLPAEHPDARLIRAGAHPRLFVLRRGLDDRGNLRSVITVEEARQLRGFFGLSAADGGRRVVIVDAADELNPNAANAILKLLEEPPARATLLLVSHQPPRLLPTIRSRCRTLRLHPLAPQDLALALDAIGLATDQPEPLAELARGSVGDAVRLVAECGLDLYAELTALLATLPRLDRPPRDPPRRLLRWQGVRPVRARPRPPRPAPEPPRPRRAPGPPARGRPRRIPAPRAPVPPRPRRPRLGRASGPLLRAGASGQGGQP